MSVNAMRQKKSQRAHRAPLASKHPVRDSAALEATESSAADVEAGVEHVGDVAVEVTAPSAIAPVEIPVRSVASDGADLRDGQGVAASDVESGLTQVAVVPAAPPRGSADEVSAVVASDTRAVFVDAVSTYAEPIPVSPPPVPVGPLPSAAAAIRLPDLMIDWTDPDMYPVKATRASVPLDLAARFKADDHATAQTQRALAAVVDNLQRLPELVLAVRGETLGAGTGFFFSPTPVKRNPAARGDVFLRLKRGEEIALERIRVWVTEVIQRDNPGRAKVSRSDLIHAALAIVYGTNSTPSPLQAGHPTVWATAADGD